MLAHKKERLEAIRQMVADGTCRQSSSTQPRLSFFAGSITPPVDSVYEFDDALKAYDRLMSLRATGKIVIKVDSTVT